MSARQAKRLRWAAGGKLSAGTLRRCRRAIAALPARARGEAMSCGICIERRVIAPVLAVEAERARRAAGAGR